MKLLVHLHVFYHDQVPWFLERLRSLDGYDWDLIVTFCEADAAMEKAVKALNRMPVSCRWRMSVMMSGPS